VYFYLQTHLNVQAAATGKDKWRDVFPRYRKVTVGRLHERKKKNLFVLLLGHCDELLLV
jgi:hypothetical protein